MNDLEIVTRTKIIMIIKSISNEGTPRFLTYMSSDWNTILFPNINLPKEEVNDHDSIRSELSNLLSVDTKFIDIVFDRNNKNMFTSTRKKTGDKEKAKQTGEFGIYNFYYAMISINSGYKHRLRPIFFSCGKIYSWMSLDDLKIISSVRQLNFDVLNFISKEFGPSFSKLPNSTHFHIVDEKNIIQDAVRMLSDSEIDGATKRIKALVTRKAGNIYKYDYFIHHASEDKDNIVKPITQRLFDMGIKCWIDDENILAGDDIHDQIVNGIISTRSVVAVISKSYLRKYGGSTISKWIKLERKYIKNRQLRGEKVHFIPILNGVTIGQFEKMDIENVGRKAIIFKNTEDCCEQIYKAHLAGR